MFITKRVFHCAICGNILHSIDGSHHAMCCGYPMHLAFKEHCLPLNDTRPTFEEFPIEYPNHYPSYSVRLPVDHEYGSYFD